MKYNEILPKTIGHANGDFKCTTKGGGKRRLGDDFGVVVFTIML